ncbi:uncharacterized protein B0H64DRAFT_179013 [Chaetomium fimeti]|uniref:HTH APSES-type domain-containing protein n=1 Tax=Chaetomium fimeti TaxID=1854472 RepID=A0AAE0HE94_9PEZI|nr:hypothetical protein B0H64DRAFT_179013 [Chaetomium fimeti]
MVSVAALLNPEPPRAPLPTSRPPPVSPSQRTVAFRSQPTPVTPSIETLRMTEDSKNAPRCTARAVMNFPPFEVLDGSSLCEVRKFQVHPFGSIQETCERIPYNSGKKDFFTKTGREGFEAFHYDFKIPGDDTNYTVMWDYCVGLVRMTSFFKCRGYSKTTPAKMLNLNPGLKDITHSITGGSIKAQGYWMPYACARAVCATFCYKIAGALIPLFGPEFPLECIPENAHGHGRMVISPDIVEQARNDAIALFRPVAALPSPRPSRSISPLPSQRSARIHESYDYPSDYDPRLLLSPYTDTDVDYRPTSGSHGRRMCTTMAPLRTPASRPPLGPAPVPTPQGSPGWAAVNRPPQPPAPYHRRGISHLHEGLLSLNVPATANPWLSAIPRSPTPGAAGGTNDWHPSYQPRSDHPNHPPYPDNNSPPPVASTSLPERGATLAPLRLKRRYSKVDATPDTHHYPHPHHNNNNTTTYNNYYNLAATTSEDDGEYDLDYDAGSSHAASPGASASVSPQSVAAAPPPTPVWTGNNSQGANAPPHPRTAKTSTTVTATATVMAMAPSPGDASEEEDGAAARRASERDAALMLMQMHLRGRGGSGGVGDGVGDGLGGKGDGAVSARPSSWAPAPVADAAGAGDAGDVADVAAAAVPAVVSVSRASQPVAAGPTTRSKRRRTLER